MIVWLARLIEILESGTLDDDLEFDIDDILPWVSAGANNHDYLALSSRVGEKLLKQRIEQLLDGLFLSELYLHSLFPRDMFEGDAKKRYRQLIRIFHPDRGVAEQSWLNSRAEKINAAYRSYVDNKDDLIDVSESHFSDTAKPYENKSKVSEPQKFKFKTSFKYRPDLLREKLGSPQEFQSKVTIGLVGLSFLMIVLVYVFRGGDSENSFFLTNESLVLSENLKKVKQDVVIEENFIVEPDARKILDEADSLFSQGGLTESFNDSGVDDYDESGGFFLDNKEKSIELYPVDEFESSKELAAGNVVVNEQLGRYSDAKHCDKRLNKVSDGDVFAARKADLSVSLNIRTGPSIECDLLFTLLPGSSLALLEQSKNNSWSKVYVESSEGQSRAEKAIGWVNSSFLDIRLREAYESSNSFEYEPKNVRVALVDKDEVVSLSSVEVKSELLESINNLKQSYEEGDVERMVKLYISSGRENQIRGIKDIRKYYKKAFTKTQNRKFEYTVRNLKQDLGASAVIEGRMNFSLEDRRSSKEMFIDADFTILLVKVNNTYKIASFDWSEI